MNDLPEGVFPKVDMHPDEVTPSLLPDPPPISPKSILTVFEAKAEALRATARIHQGSSEYHTSIVRSAKEYYKWLIAEDEDNG